jgi:hypothetical protein
VQPAIESDGLSLSALLEELLSIEQKIGARRRVCRLTFGENDPHRRVESAFSCLHGVYLSKTEALCRSVRRALEEADYLVYAMAGRSLIEQFAMLIYYGREQIEPLLAGRQPSQLSAEESQALFAVLHRFITGQRYDWAPFLQAELPRGWFREGEPVAQINILTCLKKWERNRPGVNELYGLFCDLVHPNMGSVLLHMRVEGNQLLMDDRGGRTLGRAIAERTSDQLLALLREAPDLLDRLAGVAAPGTAAASPT